MKFTDSIINKLGTDKIIHFLLACSLTALVSPFGLLVIIIVSIVVMLLELIKEIFLDDNFSWSDVLATFLGVLSSLLFNILLNFTQKFYIYN